MAEKSVSNHLEQEITRLETQLRQKRELLAQQEMPPHRELLREAVRERMETPHVSVSQPAVSAPSAPQVGAPIAAEELAAAPPEKQVVFFVNMALAQGIDPAVSMARSLNDPFLIDALHDAFTTLFFNELVKRGKLPPE